MTYQVAFVKSTARIIVIQRRLLRGQVNHSQIVQVLFPIVSLQITGKLLTGTAFLCFHTELFVPNHILTLCPQFLLRINRQNACVYVVSTCALKQLSWTPSAVLFTSFAKTQSTNSCWSHSYGKHSLS